MLAFSVEHRDPGTAARAGELVTPHGVVRTPAFMPVGTAGTVKGLAAWEIDRLSPEMVLANTYHLMLRPGVDTVETLGGVRGLLGWDGPVLTDSGGYQVFSLADTRRIDDDGVTFRSHLDGSPWRLTPEESVALQCRFGVDVAVVLDECPAHDAGAELLESSVERTIAWACRGYDEGVRRRDSGWMGGVFSVQQGGTDLELRERCTERLAERPFDGFAIGGLAVGEPRELLYDTVAAAAPLLPADRPRYLMGVGYPEDMLHAVECGVDLFDCVLPTRGGRTGQVFTSRGELAIKNARFRDDIRPLDPACDCPTCRRYSRGALRHLFVSGEAVSVVLLTLHNLTYFLSLMRAAREAIIAGHYAEYRAAVVEGRAVPVGRKES